MSNAMIYGVYSHEGSNNSPEEDEQQGREEGEKAMRAAEEKYQRILMVSKGEAIVKEQGSIVDEIKTPADLGDLFLAINSNSKLFQTLKEYDTLLSDIKRQEVDLADEIQSNKDTYLELIRMNAESTELSRIYQSTIRSLTDYQSR
jgi:vacuolar-type H+-ATPase subunit H